MKTSEIFELQEAAGEQAGYCGNALDELLRNGGVLWKLHDEELDALADAISAIKKNRIYKEFTQQ